MFNKVGLIHKNQSGVTLAELLVVIAIVGVIVVTVNTAISQTIQLSTRGPEYMTAIKQVENAFYWIGRDIKQAQTIEPGGVEGFPLRLVWVEWDGLTHEVIYTVEDSELKRSSSVNGTASGEIVVARHIDAGKEKTSCRLTTDGVFELPDSNDAFTITGGAMADNGQIVITAGSVSVATTGTATYDAGAWTAQAAGDNITVAATTDDTRGSWTADNMTALVTLSADDDSDALVTGSVLVVTITAFGGEGSQHSETRVAKINPRSRL